MAVVLQCNRCKKYSGDVSRKHSKDSTVSQWLRLDYSSPVNDNYYQIHLCNVCKVDHETFMQNDLARPNRPMSTDEVLGE